ncbi:hypothetical protein [Natrinema longum]|uniref:hypothetical protein n=1 Tax=Natrinema longum TaxID=370324 RepID=UPI0030B810C1
MLRTGSGTETITVLATERTTVTDDSSPDPSDSDASASLEDRTRALARHLEATAELPLERATSRWLGEAEAVARDAATSDLEADIVRERVETVSDLLSEADEPAHDEAREHLEAARRLCEEILGDRYQT